MNESSPKASETTGSKNSVLGTIKLIVVNFLVFAVLVELVCLLYINVTNWRASKPTYRVNYNSFWADTNPAFGVWHRPNERFFHQGGCFNVQYTTNSYGARDVERSLHSVRPRTVVLGDSFVEGLGLQDQDRLTNILEKDSGEEFLNFGTGGDFGPLQYALLYKTMASKFDHSTTLVGVLPDNDFQDMSLDWGRVHHAGRYRPYYADDFSIIYTGHFEPNAGGQFWDHVEAVLRAYLASYHVGQFIYSNFHYRTEKNYSGYNDFTQTDLARLDHALKDLKNTADEHHSRLLIFLIPTARDFRRLHAEGVNRLGPILVEWGEKNGVPVKDLLPEMNAKAGNDFESYFLSCDGHWSPLGSRTAAEVLEPWLRQVESGSTNDAGKQ